MSNKDQLTIPPAARQDPQSFELLRVWIAQQDQHVSLRAGAWKQPEQWGVVLADLAAHIANALEQAEGLNRAEALELIKDAFLDELDAPTGEPSGAID
ncbi:MAG TPA: DUF5076 domain-containing protein [Acidisarcina sp.]